MDHSFRYTARDFTAELPAAAYVARFRDAERVGGYCRECGNYGRSWGCPPFGFDMDEYLAGYASALLVARQIGRWDWRSLLAFVAGAAAAWWITVATPAETPNDWWFVMLSGAIAICAMILPGISGAFILLLLGKYQYIMQAVGDLNIPVIVIFVVGAAAGIISFSHLLSWLLKHWHDVTVAVLMGFMVGSLNKVWPWKETAETYLDSHGVAQPLVQHNVAPGTFEQLTGQPSQLVQAVLLCVVGFLAIYGIELLARIIVKKEEK